MLFDNRKRRIRRQFEQGGWNAQKGSIHLIYDGDVVWYARMQNSRVRQITSLSYDIANWQMAKLVLAGENPATVKVRT